MGVCGDMLRKEGCHVGVSYSVCCLCRVVCTRCGGDREGGMECRGGVHDSGGVVLGAGVVGMQGVQESGGVVLVVGV